MLSFCLHFQNTKGCSISWTLNCKVGYEVHIQPTWMLSSLFPQWFVWVLFFKNKSNHAALKFFYSAPLQLSFMFLFTDNWMFFSKAYVVFTSVRHVCYPPPFCNVPTCSIFSKHGINWVYRNSFFYKISIKKITSFYLQSVCYYKVTFPTGWNILFANASVPIRKVKLCVCIFLYSFVSV